MRTGRVLVVADRRAIDAAAVPQGWQTVTTSRSGFLRLMTDRHWIDCCTIRHVNKQWSLRACDRFSSRDTSKINRLRMWMSCPSTLKSRSDAGNSDEQIRLNEILHGSCQGNSTRNTDRNSTASNCLQSQYQMWKHACRASCRKFSF